MWTSYWKMWVENWEPSRTKTSCPGITTNLICHPWDPLVLMAEVFPIPCLPHCRLCSFPCISLLISLRLQCLSHYEIFIFSIPLAYGSGSLLQSFERNLNLLNTSTVGLCLGSIISGWRVLTVLWDLSAASWGPTVHSGDSSEDTEPFSAAQLGCQWHKPCSTAGCFGATLPVNSHPQG